jgi:hypothetical protein
MAVSDLDIARAAHLFIQLHGEEATARAREMVEEMRRKGDHDGADTWLRIIVAIGELGSRRQKRGTELIITLLPARCRSRRSAQRT